MGPRRLFLATMRNLTSFGKTAAKTDREVKVKGVIAGFDGPYPVVSVRSYRFEQKAKTKKNKPTK